MIQVIGVREDLPWAEPQWREGKADTEAVTRVLIEGAMAWATHRCRRNSEKGEMGRRWGRGGRF